jgi:hypothetical protein
MTFHEIVINSGVSPNNTDAITDFEIVSYKSGRTMICKV